MPAVASRRSVTEAARPGVVTLTSDAWLLVRDDCRGTSRGPVSLKGKGEVLAGLVRLEHR